MRGRSTQVVAWKLFMLDLLVSLPCTMTMWLSQEAEDERAPPVVHVMIGGDELVESSKQLEAAARLARVLEDEGGDASPSFDLVFFPIWVDQLCQLE